MFGMGMGELLLILVVALLFVGPDKLPTAARAIGKGIRDFRRHTQDLQQTIEQDANIGEAVRELRSALRDEPLRPRPAAATPRNPPALPTSPVAETGPVADDAPAAAEPTPASGDADVPVAPGGDRDEPAHG